MCSSSLTLLLLPGVLDSRATWAAPSGTADGPWCCRASASAYACPSSSLPSIDPVNSREIKLHLLGHPSLSTIARCLDTRRSASLRNGSSLVPVVSACVASASVCMPVAPSAVKLKRCSIAACTMLLLPAHCSRAARASLSGKPMLTSDATATSSCQHAQEISISTTFLSVLKGKRPFTCTNYSTCSAQ